MRLMSLKGSKHYYLKHVTKVSSGLSLKRDHGSYHLLRPNRPLVYSLILKLNYYHKVLIFGFHVKQFSKHRGQATKSVWKCHCDRVVVSKALDKSTNFQSVTACVDLANY